MVTQEENVDRVSQYESFYAGTRQSGGTVYSQGSTTSTGRPIQVPISNQAYMTPEGWTVPYASSPNEVMFIVDGKPVGMTLTDDVLASLQSGTITPADIFSGAAPEYAAKKCRMYQIEAYHHHQLQVMGLSHYHLTHLLDLVATYHK